MADDPAAVAEQQLTDAEKRANPIRLAFGGRVIGLFTVTGFFVAGYTDAFRHLQPDLVGHTFPTWDPHARLDYLFVPERCIDRVARSSPPGRCAPRRTTSR